MAKSRMVNTKFWDDAYISELDPIEKLLFLYLLTNSATTICGIYELPVKKMSVDTGIEKEMLLKILGRFAQEDKIIFFKGWVIIKNFTKHQNEGSPTIKRGIEVALEAVPREIMDIYQEKIKGIDTLSYLNLNSNLNSNTNTQSVESDFQEELKTEFESFWNLYGKKISRPKCEKKWSKLSKKDRDAILAYIPGYVKSTPDIKYRKNPETFLNNRSWEDEIITDQKESPPSYVENGWDASKETYEEHLRKKKDRSSSPYAKQLSQTMKLKN